MPASGKKYGLGSSRAREGVELTLPSLADPDRPFNDDPESPDYNPHNVCRVRRPGAEGLIAAGVLDNFDSLTEMVELEHLAKASGRVPRSAKEGETGERLPEALTLKEQLQQVSAMRDQITKGLAVADDVVVHCVLEPKVLSIPTTEVDGVRVQVPIEDRADPGDAVYVDEVTMEDKLFILQFCVGGSADLETFRSGSQAIVGAVENVEGVRLPTL